MDASCLDLNSRSVIAQLCDFEVRYFINLYLSFLFKIGNNTMCQTELLCGINVFRESLGPLSSLLSLLPYYSFTTMSCTLKV